jgi:DNA-binding transcriptional ArsR family regulator
VAIPEWELNLFTADPRHLSPQEHRHYLRGAEALAALATPSRLRLVHALLVGERSLVRAAAWAQVSQSVAQSDLRALEARGLVRREINAGEVEFAPADGHVVVAVHVALAHGGHTRDDGSLHPVLLHEKRRLAGARRSGGQ